MGEARIGKKLQSKLDESQYHTLHNLTLKTPTGTTQIDHVIVSANGIFVIETKNMAGWIFGGERQPRWTQTFRKKKFQFQNPLRQNYKHIKVIQDLLELDDDHFHNVVVFVGEAEPKTEMPANVLWGAGTIAPYVMSKTGTTLTQEQVYACIARLRNSALAQTRETNKEHIRYLKTRAKIPASPVGKDSCPRCEGNLILRTNKKSGEHFYGCSNFPKCRATRKA